MPTQEHLEGQWREWRHARIAELSRPYGWPSLVAQHWLQPGGQPVELEDLPGLWADVDGHVIFTPPASGPNLSVDGEYPTAPVEIIPGRNMAYGNGASVPVYFGDREVESILRTNDDDEKILAVRVRDPKVSAAKDFSDLEAYDYDPAWRLPATFTPAEARDFEAPTVEVGVRETTTRIGTLRVELQGRVYDLAVIGKQSKSGINPVIHLRDRTNGVTTYGAGRVVGVPYTDHEHRRIDVIDFNYLTPLPCAFTNFVTCPLPPKENTIDLQILAGEKKPARDVERILTYSV
jgi:uncharacterized protein